jgi:hypothetical protein
MIVRLCRARPGWCGRWFNFADGDADEARAAHEANCRGTLTPILVVDVNGIFWDFNMIDWAKSVSTEKDLTILRGIGLPV